jgi:murein DD-endopeptidase MepM/ murein hydrolase activator NlpD
MFKCIKFLFILSLLLARSSLAAQGQSNSQPVYIVQAGDTLNTIAYLFNISPIDLADVNGITNPDQISIGEQLVIPGITGISGIIQAVVVPYGQTLESISQQYQVPVDTLIDLNHITSPMELYAGSSLIVPQPEGTSDKTISQAILQKGETLIEAAAENGLNPWVMALSNGLHGTWDSLPGQSIFYQTSSGSKSSEMLNPFISSISIQPLPIVQGNTLVVDVKTKDPITLGGSSGVVDVNSKNPALGGSLDRYTLKFVQSEENHYVALQGISAMQDTGLYPLRLFGTFADGSGFDYQQNVLIKPGYFPEDPKLTVPPETLDPAVTGPEDNQIAAVVGATNPTRYWTGTFRAPVDEPICIESGYGDRRSYNGSDYIYFHTGIDYGVCANLNIYAPAPGVVVFTGLLSVRGNTTIIDHGWGVYSGLYHQSKILVQVGQIVKAGEQIGIIGATGRVDGPHLHWDLFVNGTQADPLDWLMNTYPYP